jgi:hypothetical protein
MSAKKRMFLVLIFAIMLGFLSFSEAGAMPMFWGWPADGEASPGLAALLSLLPVPVAAGQFYVGDWRAGLAFTSIEVAEAVTATAVFVYEGGAMMGRGVAIKNWDTTGQIVFVSALGGLFVTKLVDAVFAASTADAKNRNNSDAKISLAARNNEVDLSIAY